MTRRALGDCSAAGDLHPVFSRLVCVYIPLVVLAEAGGSVAVKGGGMCQGYLHF